MQDDARYKCQIALPGFGNAAQQLLGRASVLIAGAGGLGCPAAQYLAASGIGTIGIADFDTVSLGNLHRQILYTPADIGNKKANTACEKLQQQNPQIKLVPHDTRITSANVAALIARYDIIVDGTDNFETKYVLNDACVLAGKPLVYAAIYQYEGQLAIWNVQNADGAYSPNYRDVYPEVNAAQIPNCTDGGVLPTLAGIIGCMQANEVIKLITKKGDPLAGKLLIIDVLTLQSRIVKLGTTTKTNIMSLPPISEVPTISMATLKANMKDYELVDVRTADERKAFNIGGWHIPLADIEIDTSYLFSEKPVVFYCATGARSAEAARVVMRDYPGVKTFSLEGGIGEG